MQHFSASLILGISKAFLALTKEKKGIVWTFRKVELQAEKAENHLFHRLHLICWQTKA